MFKGLKIIKLDHLSSRASEVVAPEIDQRLFAEEEELSLHGFSVDFQQIRAPALRIAGGQKIEQGLIELTFFLLIAGVKSGRGETLSTYFTEESLDPLFIAAPSIDSDPYPRRPRIGCRAQWVTTWTVSRHSSGAKQNQLHTQIHTRRGPSLKGLWSSPIG